GHRGTFTASSREDGVGVIALVPQIIDAIPLPVIAAGGISDGRGIAAALVLGAAGVQMGTAFLGCPEAELDPVYRRILSEPRAAHTRVTRLLSGRPARAIVTRFIEEMQAEEPDTLDFPLQEPCLDHSQAPASNADKASSTPCGQANLRGSYGSSLLQSSWRLSSKRWRPFCGACHDEFQEGRGGGRRPRA